MRINVYRERARETTIEGWELIVIFDGVKSSREHLRRGEQRVPASNSK